MNDARSDSAAGTTQRSVMTVTELNERVRGYLQDHFGSVWVSGEIGDVARPRSGHIYLTLKDAQSQLRAVIWRSLASRMKFDLQDGMQVVCEGTIDLYPARGSCQLMIRQLEPLGVGALQLALQQLRDKLAAEGLFDPQRKRPLPPFPRRVAVVTSPSGAAIRDFLEVQRRRWRGTDVLVIPTRVQGAEAVSEILMAIQQSQRLVPAPDVIVLTRGGGSLEDLWCFNDERVVRALAASSIPTISAIGHEIDVTLCDLVADVRALTPSEAAERVSPSHDELRHRLRRSGRQLAAQMMRQLQLKRTLVDGLAQRPVLVDPGLRLRDLSRRIDEYEQRMANSARATLKNAALAVRGASSRLEALSPLAVLGRGYSLTLQPDGQLVRAATEVQQGDPLQIKLAHGALEARVTARQIDDPMPSQVVRPDQSSDRQEKP